MTEFDNLDDLIEEIDSLTHYGIKRRSGRYPWGSGEKYQRSLDFRASIQDLRKKGYNWDQIAEMRGLANAAEVKRRYSIATNEVKMNEYAQLVRLRDKGYGYTKIGEITGMNESTVRSKLEKVREERRSKTVSTVAMLKDELENGREYIDVGLGVANRLGISDSRMQNVLQILKDEGYKVHNYKIEQIGTGNETTMKVLTKGDVSLRDVKANGDKIAPPQYYSEGGEIKKMEPPTSVDSSRIFVRYAEDGGKEKDGLIELRRGVEDISLGNARYAQVRIAVDGTHYLKGMAMPSDDIPKGYDIVFNTNKSKDVPPISKDGGDEVFKKLKDISKKIDGNPFGASIKVDDELVLAQRHYKGKDGKEHLSAINIVSEEGNWTEWGRNLASQFLSKQPVPLAKRQLDKRYAEQAQELDSIMHLTNPAVKKKLLEDFANNCDSAAVHLKAAALPRQQTHVILPFPEMKPTEVYAPNFKNGEKVVLIRYPHGGKFELAELTVNNKVPSVVKALGNAKDAIGINFKVAEKLSGADFDGDTAVVIPNNSGAIKTSPTLAGLKDFDPKIQYKHREGARIMKDSEKGDQMGRITNLITDMTLKGATPDDLAAAVRHSMVVIDAPKHKLDYKQSEIDNRIAYLKTKYQGSANAGASTIISRAKSPIYIPDRTVKYSEKDEKGNKIIDQGIYVETGEKAYKPTGKMKPKKIVDKKTGEVTWELVPKTIKIPKMANVSDARDLMSSKTDPYPMEEVYANFANRMKALANTARKEYLKTPNQKESKTAKKVYAVERASLIAKLNEAMKNKPLERMAQNLGNTIIKGVYQDNPDMDADTRKKTKDQALKIARARVGANKPSITITPKNGRQSKLEQ